MKKHLVIGIGGLAGSGKDTLCNLLIQSLYLNGITSKRRALADELKTAIRPVLLRSHGIDVLNCSREEKEAIRPELVAYGKELREISEGKHWTSIVQDKIQQDEEDVIIVPDIRYNFYPEDEMAWVKQKNKGFVVHVARFDIVNGVKTWAQPPNKDEAINDPTVRRDADFSLSWSTAPLTELQKDFGGFLQTLSLVAQHELNNLKR